MTSILFPPCAGSGARIGLGGAPLGNLFARVDGADADALLDAAWASGCRSFDTAPHYGHGLSERRLGDALRGHPRTDFVLSSKVGRLLVPDPGAPRTNYRVASTPYAVGGDHHASRGGHARIPGVPTRPPGSWPAVLAIALAPQSVGA